MFGVHIQGDSVKGRGRMMLNKLRPAAANAVRDALHMTYGAITEEMRRPKHGRRYRKRGGRIHQASAPGEAPAIDTADLINSLYIVGPNWKNWEVTGHVAIRGKKQQEKAKRLEHGTSKMEPRPIFRLAMRKVQPKVKVRMRML